MAEEKKEGIEKPQSTPEEKAKEEVNVDELIEKAKEEARLEAIKEAEGKFKKEISTRDQTITKLQKDVNATKSEEERKQIEAEERHKTVLKQ